MEIIQLLSQLWGMGHGEGGARMGPRTQLGYWSDQRYGGVVRMLRSIFLVGRGEPLKGFDQ